MPEQPNAVWGERPKNNVQQQAEKQDVNLAFKSYKQEMTIFLDEEKDDTDSDQEEETEEINIAVSDVNLPNTADRDYDVLETQENEVISAAKEESEPFNLEDLNVSIPNLKYDVDEHFLEILMKFKTISHKMYDPLSIF